MKMKLSARHYAGDWIAGGLYVASTLISIYHMIELAQSPYGHRPVLVFVEWTLWLTVVLTIPLVLSLRAGAIIALLLQVVTLAFFLVQPSPLSERLVIPVALTCYCIARLRNAIGPPLIVVRASRAITRADQT